jgi:hypothetical protein
MFAIVCNNKVMSRCENIGQIDDHVKRVMKQMESMLTSVPWGHNIDVYAYVGGYTTRQVESWPKEKYPSYVHEGGIDDAL